MKKFLIFFFLLTFFLQNLNAFEKAIFTKEEKEFIKQNPIINVGAEKDWPPFEYFEEGEYKGLAKDYLDLIEDITSLKFKYHIDTWENLLNRTKNKDLDLLPILSKNAKRDEFLNYTNSYLAVRDYVFAKPMTNLNTIEDFNGKTVAIVKGYVQEEHFKKYHLKTNILLVGNVLEAIDAVVTNKADFTISNIAIFNYQIKKHSINNINAKFHMNYDVNKLYMATKKDSSILRDIIQKALNNITLHEKNDIYSKWINTDNKPKLYTSLNLTKKEKEYINNTKQLIVANELSYKPYDYNDNGIAKGYTIDYIKLLFSKIGIIPIFKADTWSKMIQDFKDKKIDILPIITKNKKREEYINFTNSYLNQNMSIITKINNSSIINIDDLNGKTIALPKNWNMTKFVKKYHPKIKIIEYNTVPEFLDAVTNNYAEASILDNLSANYYIKANYQDKLHITGTAKIKNFNPKIHIGVQKEVPILKNILEKAMLVISKEENKRLNSKWINLSKNLNLTEEEKNFIQKNKIKVTSTKSWAPFNFIENDTMEGISVEFWKYIVDKANLKTEFRPKETFVESVLSIKNKHNDIIVGTSKTKERDNYAIFSDTYLKSPLGIATLQDKNFIRNASELLDKKIAVGRNFSAHRLLEEKYPNMTFVFVRNPKEGLEYLSDNKVYAYVDIMPVLTYNIKHLGFTNIKITGQTGLDFNLKFMIRDDYPILQSIINKVLRNMTQDEKEKIYNKWLKIDFQESIDYSLLWKIILIFLIILIFVLYKNKQLFDYQKSLKNTQKELENSLENFKSLIDLNIAGVLIVESKKIRYLNDEIVNMLGYRNKSQLISRDLTNILKENSLINIYKEHDKRNYEIEAIKVDGTSIPILLKSKQIMFDNKPSFILSIINLTEIKNKEEIMLQQSKMASLGEMIGNIAHQWRQPLSSISTAASGMKIQKEHGLLNDELLDYNLDSITETTKFLSQTIDDFQNYIKSDKKKKKFDIKNSIEKVLTIVNASFKNNFINVNSKINSIFINGFENELNQALLNILTNSKDALKEKKEESRNIYIYSYIKDEFAIIEIIDTAGGIDKEIIQKVFEPYFTTKHKSQGTGLGLYMTHKIITDSMKGSITIENTEYDNKKGTKVTLSIPIK